MADTIDWPAALHRTIMLAQLQHSESNPRSQKYPSGDLWKCLLTISILRDLNAATDDDTNTTRFLRINHAGLSGALFYPTPTRRALIPDEQTIDLEVDALIKGNAVQILYFPNLACTSFVIGQVMKAHLLSDSTISPKPHLSGSGFSLNSHALEALGHALAGGSSIPIRDLSGELKPTPRCADRVLKDRRLAARQLLVARYRNAVRNGTRDPIRLIPRVIAPSSVPKEIKLDNMLSLDSRREDVNKEGPQDALDTPQSPTLRSNAAIPRADKHPLLPVLGNHRHANKPTPASVDAQSVKKHSGVLEPAGGKGKENDV
ncbi:hypothetical protein MVEN_00512400 [Mycena venus]|uniref:Uncharacterized protein n=1 Tax=Mycena venus TaxID=2733690 RepID=A0A8H7D4A6_9AGAR|nr:hypothetical protein MVEN_00512400 [Mycena venus]